MECFIITESVDISTESQYLKNIHEHKINLELVLKHILLNEKYNKILKTGYGLITNINKHNYVITVHHCLGYYPINICCYLEYKGNIIRIPLKYINAYPEIDIAILEPINDEIINHLPQSELKISYDLKTIIDSKNSYIKSFNSPISAVLSEEKFKSIDLETNISELTLSSIKSIMVPKLPIINFTCKCDNPFGLSGSIIINDEKYILGMTYCYNNKKMFEALPIGIIMIFVNKLINFIPFSTLIFNTTICDVTVDNKKYTGHVLNDTNEVQYQITSKKQKITFKKDDVVIGINDKYFNCNGTIHDDRLMSDLPINTYILLNETINVNLIYLKEKNGKYSNPKSINIQSININDLFCVNISNPHKYFVWNGLIFAVLSEELIVSLVHKYSCFPFMEEYKIFGKKKFIILLDIDCELHGKTYNTYKFNIIEKIGRKNISNIEDLEQIFIETSKKEQSTIKIIIKQSFKSEPKCVLFNIFH